MRTNDLDAGGGAVIPWVLAAAILLLAASSCTNDASVSGPTSNPTIAPSREPAPATSPTPSPASQAKDLGIFSEVGGWITFGGPNGIWAVKPTPGSLPSDRIQLSERPGEPLAWSSDGSKLLFIRNVSDATLHPAADLFVLNADGTETRLTKYRGEITGSISPDGSQVIYGFDGDMYTVDTEGGEPRFLLASAGWGLFIPTFSPDGAQIAYFDGGGDVDNTLRVMNADGSGVRVVIDQEFGHVNDLAWSPDGSRLAFHGPYGGGIWIVGVDGSGLTQVSQWGAAPRWSPTGRQLAFESAGGIWVINADGSGLRQVTLPGRRAPVWSPDGSRIAYLGGNRLYVADLEGTHLRSLGTLKLTPSPKPPVVWIPVSGADGRASDSAPITDRSISPGIVVLCTTMDMGPLTGWKDPVTVVELDARGVYAQAPTGQTMYAWGIGDAVWVASTDKPDKGASIWPSSAQGTVILPVNKAAREYDHVTGTDVRSVIQAGFADALEEAEGALAGCG